MARFGAICGDAPSGVLRLRLALFCALLQPPAACFATEEEITRALRADQDALVRLFAENGAFDNWYGNFLGARNLSEVLDAA